MPPDVTAHIFEPFFTTKPEGKGTGLGLSMVFGFMKQSGGHVEVYSELGLGTTFRLYLPRALTSTASIRNLKPRPTVAPTQQVSETVLAVEDNPSLRALVVRQLTQLGYRCFEAADGPSALKILESERIDLLFSDVIMPGGMSGYDLTEQARSRWPNLKILLTSGFPEEKVGGMATSIPKGIQLLGKPYRKEDLAAALRGTLARGEKGMELDDPDRADWTA